MITVSTTYALKWQHKQYHNYKWSECGKLFNGMTGRQIKKTVCGGSIGYCIKGKFQSVNTLRSQLELIPEQESPF